MSAYPNPVAAVRACSKAPEEARAPVKWGGFSKQMKKVENHRRTVAQAHNSLTAKLFPRDGDGGGWRFRPSEMPALGTCRLLNRIAYAGRVLVLGNSAK
jgi:hypothetical protein